MTSRLSIISLWMCFCALLMLGLIMVASTGLCTSDSGIVAKQCEFAVLGLMGALLISSADYHILRRWIVPLWWLCVVLLACCYLPFIGKEVNGEHRWLNLGFLTFQPSEVAKIVLMLTLAHWYTTHREIAGTFWKGFAYPGFLFGFPLLLILMEKDMGTAAALAMSGFCVMFVAGARGWLLLLSLLLGAVALYLLTTSSENRMLRIEAWRDPQAYSQGAGCQQWIAILSFARGGLFGVGLGDGINKYGSLPYAHTDFIFAEIGEEWGFAGSLTVLLLYTGLTVSGIIMALKTQDTFGRLLAVGLVSTIFCPAMLNLAVVTALLPNSGLPLPFISYGGTNLVFTIAAIGLITSIQRHTPKPQETYWPRRRQVEDPKLR